MLHIVTNRQGSPVSSKAEKIAAFSTVFSTWKKQFLPVSSAHWNSEETQKWGECFLCLFTGGFFILSFIYGTKLLNYIKIGSQDILDIITSMTPSALTFFVECSFLVFSTNKLRVIMFSCKYQKNWKWKFAAIEDEIAIFKLHWIFNPLQCLVHFHKILKKTLKLEALF